MHFGARELHLGLVIVHFVNDDTCVCKSFSGRLAVTKNVMSILMCKNSQVWLNSMLKLSTNDEMVAAGELCLSAGMMSPVPCMLSFSRSITEYILEQNVEFGEWYFLLLLNSVSLVLLKNLTNCFKGCCHIFTWNYFF